MKIIDITEFEVDTPQYKATRKLINKMIKDNNRNRGSKYFRGRPDYNLPKIK